MLTALLLAAATVGGDGTADYANSYLGERPPSLASSKAVWVNRDVPPTLESLRGKVVLLVFTSVY